MESTTPRKMQTGLIVILVVAIVASIPSASAFAVLPTTTSTAGPTSALFLLRRVKNLGQRIFGTKRPRQQDISWEEVFVSSYHHGGLNDTGISAGISALDMTGSSTLVAPNNILEIESKKSKSPEPKQGTHSTKEAARKLEASLLVKQVDDLFKQDDPQAAFEALKTQSVLVEKEPELLWRWVKSYYKLFAATECTIWQEKHLLRGIALANKGLHLYSDNVYLLKWKAIMLGKMGQFQSTREKMQNSVVIKECLEKAQQQLPHDASIRQALGEWSFKVASRSFVEHQVASMLFGTPPHSTYEEALGHFEQAFELRPSATKAIKVSEALHKLGRSTKAQAWKNKAASLTLK